VLYKHRPATAAPSIHVYVHGVYRIRYEYFLSDDPLPYLTTLTSEQREVATDGQTNGRTDKNRQTIAVTLRQRFAVRVNEC
jgi:hypothetical protein